VNKQAEIEVAWYLLHGSYRERIATGRSGRQYVIGDSSWNNCHTTKYEVIEHLLPKVPAHSGQGLTDA